MRKRNINLGSLANLRRKLNVTREQLATESGVSVDTISSIEEGRFVTLDKLTHQKLGDALQRLLNAQGR